MFEFFRTGIHGDELLPNIGYWEEKCVSHSRKQLRHYAPEVFESEILRMTLERRPRMGSGTPQEFSQAMRRYSEAVIDTLRNETWLVMEDEGEAIRSLQDVSFGGDPVFDDLWECDFTEWDYHFVWCLHAILWAIRAYDAARNSVGESAEAAE